MSYSEKKKQRGEIEQLVRDNWVIKKIAKFRGLKLEDQTPGPFELEVVTEDFSYNTERAIGYAEDRWEDLVQIARTEVHHFSLARALIRRQDEQTEFLDDLVHEVKETHFVLEDIRDLECANLVAAGAQLAVDYAQLSRLDDIGETLSDFSERFGDIEYALEYQGELLESINEGVWGLSRQVEGLENRIVEVGDRTTDAVVKVGKVVVGTVVETGNQIIQNQVRVGKAIVQEIRLSEQQSTQILGRHISRASQTQTKEIKSLMVVLDERAHERHEELVRGVISPVSNTANEKYTQARTLFLNGELGRSLCKLSDEVFSADDTHPRGWILYGEISERRGRPREARAAFKRASEYALIQGKAEIYELACLRWARLELTVGNVRQAKNVLITAQRQIIQRQGTKSGYIAYELFKINFAEGQRQWSKAREVKLRGILLLAPELHDDVARNPLLESLRLYPCGPLTWGHAPFIQLFDLLMHYKEIFTTNRQLKNDSSTQFSVEILEKVLHLTEAGRVRHATHKNGREEMHPSGQDVSSFAILEWMQNIAVSFAKQLDADHPTSEGNAKTVLTALRDVVDNYLEDHDHAFETLLCYYANHVNDSIEGEDPFARKYVDPEDILSKYDMMRKDRFPPLS